jgi:hypothetical protein
MEDLVLFLAEEYLAATGNVEHVHAQKQQTITTLIDESAKHRCDNRRDILYSVSP